MSEERGYPGLIDRLKEMMIGDPDWASVAGEIPAVVSLPQGNRVPNTFPAISFNIRYSTESVRYRLKALTTAFLLVDYWDEASSASESEYVLANISRYRDAFISAFTNKYQMPLGVLRFQPSTSGEIRQVPRNPKIYRLRDQIQFTVSR